MAAAGVESVYGDAAFLRFQKSCCQVEQCALAHSVLAQQAVDAAFVEPEAEAVKHVVLASPVAEGEVVCLNHLAFSFKGSCFCCLSVLFRTVSICVLFRYYTANVGRLFDTCKFFGGKNRMKGYFPSFFFSCFFVSGSSPEVSEQSSMKG